MIWILERIGTERDLERNGTERDLERNGTERRNGTGKTDPFPFRSVPFRWNGTGTDRTPCSKLWNGTERNGSDFKTLERNGLERNGTGDPWLEYNEYLCKYDADRNI